MANQISIGKFLSRMLHRHAHQLWSKGVQIQYMMVYTL